MDISIRQHIINNFREDDVDELRKAIDESIKENDEVTLPGMGVFFEVLWTDASEELKDEILTTIKARLEKE